MLTNTIVVGIDEAGRGCLAGPVYAGAVILQCEEGLEKIRDSKELSESRREEIFNYILSSHRVGHGFANVEEIARLNILNAAMLAMRRAFAALKLSEEELGRVHVMVDGNQKIREFIYNQTTVVQGDKKVKAIAAASIVAKVLRDRELRRLHEKFPQYGYDQHKGYGTELHREAIKKFGPTEHHRHTFAGVKEYLPNPVL